MPKRVQSANRDLQKLEGMIYREKSWIIIINLAVNAWTNEIRKFQISNISRLFLLNRSRSWRRYFLNNDIFHPLIFTLSHYSSYESMTTQTINSKQIKRVNTEVIYNLSMIGNRTVLSAYNRINRIIVQYIMKINMYMFIRKPIGKFITAHSIVLIR